MKKKLIKQLRGFAKDLPDMIDVTTHKTLPSFNPDGTLRQPTIIRLRTKVNHVRRMKRRFIKEGMPGVKAYILKTQLAE